MTIHVPDEEAFIIGSTAEPGKIGKPIFCDYLEAPKLKEIS